MVDSLELPSLFVEGDTDLHTILHLVGRHGIVLDKDLGPVLIKNARNDQGVLDSMSTAVRASSNRAVGFVIDADVPVAHRWQAVCDRLSDIDLSLPDVAPLGGFIGVSARLKSRVGVWIMPDNVLDEGKLEDLVRTLVPTNDALIDHAQNATGTAFEIDGRFAPVDRRKADLHCWLSWQEEPGKPFGTALKAHYFRHDSEAAIRFVSWFRNLFNLPA